MYEPVWRAVSTELSGERAKEYVERLWRHARWNSFDRMQDTASEIASICREIGLKEVEIVRYPADGVTSHGGWVMPEAWDVDDASLGIAEPAVPDPVLAHYRDCPQSLMMYSAPTPPDGVVAEVVAVGDAGKEASYQGLDLKGKLVLTDGLGSDTALQAFERGAIGIVSDFMKLTGSPQDKGDGSLDRACQWHNYTIPPCRWKRGSGERRGFGFSISPAAGRRLRELLRTHGSVRLGAVVRTRLHDGELPLVTGLLPGKTREEIVLTGHLCEPGANDNSSGVALGLEVIRTVRELSTKGKLGPLERGLRPVYSFEVRGYQAFLATYERLRQFMAGINLDMVGNDLSDARSVCNLVYNFPTLPAYTDFLALDLLRRLERDDGLFRFRTESGSLVDNLFGEPSVGAPMCVLGCWPDAYYHNSLDTPEHISPAALRKIGRVTATYCYFLATAGFPEAMWLARLVESCAEEEIIQAVRSLVAGAYGPGRCPDRAAGRDTSSIDERIGHLTQKNVERLNSVGRLVRPRGMILTREDLERNADWRCPGSGLFKDVELGEHLKRSSERLRQFARRYREIVEADERRLNASGASRGRADQVLVQTAARMERETPKRETDTSGATAGTCGPACADEAAPARRRPGLCPDRAEEERASRIVPLRTFRGSLCFESLDGEGRKELTERTGLTVGWGAAYWLQLAMFLSDGKRTALDIHTRLRRESQRVSLSALNNMLEFLADHGFVRMRPVLWKGDYLAAFREVGLLVGDVVMVHSSLSRFGYVEGGPETVISALLEALGPDGTLVMPAFTCSFAGRPPFDQRKSPSRVGAITEAFRRRPGVLRSSHPSHSVAAFGPKAKEIVHDCRPERPVFSDEGAFGRLYGLDARVLMLAPLESNTCLHMGEERAGIPLRDAVAWLVGEDGPREVTVSHAPLHTDSFDEYYKALFERGLVRSAPLGEEKTYLMRLRDAVDVATENLRRHPLLATAEGCECETCRLVRQKVGRADL